MELSDFDKGRIEGRSGSMSHSQIARETGIPRTTITDFLTHSKNRGNPDNLPRPGRPRITTVA